MRVRRRSGFLSLLLCCIAAAASGATRAPLPADLLDRAELLLAEGRAPQSYALLAPFLADGAGDTRYDYALALAALGSQQPAAAVAPLRRVLTIEPRLEGARLDLARALRDSGEANAARAEYARVLETSASDLTRRIAQRELASLGAATAPATAWHPSVTLGAGFDSNANAATSDSSFNGFTLDPRSTEQSSPFAEAGAALRGSTRVADGLDLDTQLRAGHRLDTELRYNDQTVVDGGAAVSLRRHGWLGTFGANASWVLIDGRGYAGTGYAELSLSHLLGAQWELAGLARAGRVDYRQDGYQPLDVERFLWGGALQRFGLRDGSARLGLALLGGRDIALRAGSPFSNDRYGARLFGAWRLDARRELHGEISWLVSDFYGAQGFLGTDRLDRQYVLSLGLDARDWPARGWSAGPQLRATRTVSNVGVFEFDRVEVAIFLQREFR